MFDRFFLFSPPRFDNRRQSSPVVVTALAGRSETVSPLKQFPRVSVSIRAPNVHAMSSGTRTARTHHHRRRIPFLSLERIEEEKELTVFALGFLGLGFD